jgi:hypothetical protein
VVEFVEARAGAAAGDLLDDDDADWAGSTMGIRGGISSYWGATGRVFDRAGVELGMYSKKWQGRGSEESTTHLVADRAAVDAVWREEEELLWAQG